MKIDKKLAEIELNKKLEDSKQFEPRNARIFSSASIHEAMKAQKTSNLWIHDFVDKSQRRERVQDLIQRFVVSPQASATVWFTDKEFIDSNAFFQSLKNEANRLFPGKIDVYYNVKLSRTKVYLFKTDDDFIQEMIERWRLNNEEFNDTPNIRFTKLKRK